LAVESDGAEATPGSTPGSIPGSIPGSTPGSRTGTGAGMAEGLDGSGAPGAGADSLAGCTAPGARTRAAEAWVVVESGCGHRLPAKGNAQILSTSSRLGGYCPRGRPRVRRLVFLRILMPSV
jgi:hypothetical protein